MGIRWVVLTTAPDQIVAEIWAEMLRTEGLPARVHPGDVVGFLGVGTRGVRILTSEATLQRAHDLLEELTSKDDNGPYEITS